MKTAGCNLLMIVGKLPFGFTAKLKVIVIVELLLVHSDSTGAGTT
jgi:hypothetical protein